MVRDPDLLAELEARTNGPKHGRSFKKVCDVWGIPDLELVRWKFNEYDYYSAEKVGMPITARGLFTTENDRILVRGYDKFFSIDEVRHTKLPFLRSELVGPFYATVKENGYLVLIGGYNGKLIITSKNGSGPSCTADDGKNYSKTAREWVLKHLQLANQNEQSLAEFLEQRDLTAVGEVCDDSFEEHVLPYTASAAGIYLNGLVSNTKQFATEPPSRVQQIARQYGFHRTEYVEFADFPSLEEFLERGQQSGTYGSRDVEGFVVRAKRKSNNTDFFFKFKFDEPYLMYREWREVVKEFVNSDAATARRRAMRSKHRGSALKFLSFAETYLSERPDLVAKLQNQNLGIIALREAFFAAQAADLTQINGDADSEIAQALLNFRLSVRKVLLVTVATLGCGKSTVAKTLVQLAPQLFGHRQNDAMVSQRGKSKFAVLQSAIINDFLDGFEIVTLDRNNSSRQERQQIFDEFEKLATEMNLDIQYVCLNYLPEGPSLDTQQLTRERVYARQDQHATVQLSVLGKKGIEGIMSQFENRFQTVNSHCSPDSQFHAVIDLEAGNSAANAERVLQQLRSLFPSLGVPAFSFAEIAAAVANVREADRNAQISQIGKSRSSKPKPADQNSKASPESLTKKQIKKLRYFGIELANEAYANLHQLATKLIPDDVLKNLTVNTKFHVTLAHQQSHKTEFAALLKQHSPHFSEEIDGRVLVNNESRTVRVTGIAWSVLVAAFTVEVANCANAVAHITIGTAKTVSGRDANKLFTNEFTDSKIEVHRQPISSITFENQPVFASP